MTVQLNQVQSGDFLFNTPVEIGYYTLGKSTPTILKMKLSAKSQRYSFSVGSSPLQVELDPRNVLLNNGSLRRE